MEPSSNPARPGTTRGPEPGGQRLDAQAVADLFDEHGSEVYRFLLGVLRDPHAAQDALQATFTKVLESGHTARPEAMRAWLFQVAYREAITLRRRGTRHDRLQRGLAWLREASLEPIGSPDIPLIRDEIVETVRIALNTLSPEQRDIVQARIYEDKTFAQIAQERQLPLGTVLTRMRRALEKLSRCLRDETEP